MKIPFLWLLFIFYVILIVINVYHPMMFKYLLLNPIGWVLLFFVVALSYSLNKEFGYQMGFTVFLLLLMAQTFSVVEKFESGGDSGSGNDSGKWDAKTIREFSEYQSTANPNLIFDLPLLQKQASQKEVKILMETGMWPWSDTTQSLFMQNIQNNPMIKVNPWEAMRTARKIYNEEITKEMLSWKTLEGQFLLNGVYVENPQNHAADSAANTYGVNSGLVSQNRDIIRCGPSKINQNKLEMQRIHNLGNDGITGAHRKQYTTIPYEELPNVVPLFTFLDKPCNPCLALESDYSCSFSMQKNGEVSPIWKLLSEKKTET